ncbi:rRNA maturation RNase YbeY [Engelhardtia mirabilis]|uniref:Endoribonuclease YbeY n=1 Tax=Engelhardtia mirabilis TaxID=2528011 RepID=A0A518BPU8_9BACT|nr:Endoribonuclease YbeY [Planctomycetes bacterium Pla133]QDV03322.1 Endoribonuclease YbeY [Planctomycetes bacterium Pla86]
MKVHVEWLVEPVAPGDDGVARAVREALEYGQRPDFELSVALVDDPTLAELHERCLGDPSVTDVMSFDLEDDGPGPGGEVIVSVDRARAVSSARGTSLEREITLYLVHGTLHLCGYDDHEAEDRQRMRAAESAVMQRLGFEPDERPHDL